MIYLKARIFWFNHVLPRSHGVEANVNSFSQDVGQMRKSTKISASRFQKVWALRISKGLGSIRKSRAMIKYRPVAGRRVVFLWFAHGRPRVSRHNLLKTGREPSTFGE